MVGVRPQIAADIADGLIRRLHAAGLELHGAVALVDNAEARELFESAIATLDDALRIIHRATLSSLPPDEN